MNARRFVLRAGAVAAMGGAGLLAAAAVASASNAGDDKLDNWSPPFVTNDNHPHLSCSFAVQFFNFSTADKANTATVTFTGQSPTGQGTSIPITLGPTGSFTFPDSGAAADAGKVVNGPKGTGWAQHFQLDTTVLGAPQPNQGFHVSIDAVVNGNTLKQKTVWVRPCNAPGPDVSLEKTGPATGVPGGQGTYDLRAANEGDGDAPASTIVDTLPTGETFVSASGDVTPGSSCTVNGHDVSCPIGTLPAHTSKTIHVVVAYDSSLADLSQLTDCATVTGSQDNPCVTTTLHKPNVHLAKDGPATAVAGGKGTYDITASNTGSADATNQTITDTLPAGETFDSATGATCTATSIAGGGQSVSCPIGTLGAGSHKTVSVTVDYDAGLANGTSLKDCATVTGSTDNPCKTTIIHKPHVTVAKSGPAIGLLGDNGTYTIVATNDGAAASAATTFTDTLPSGETFVPQGSSAKCSAVGLTVTCQLGALDAKGGAHDSESFTIVVSYSKTGDLTDCATINGQPVASCVTTNIRKPDLQVKKTGPATGTLNGDGTYTMVVTNNGTADSTATTFTDTLPAGEAFVSNGSSSACSANGQVLTCTVPALTANGGSTSYTVVVTYTQTGNLTDCATIAGQPVPSCVTTHIPGQPSLTVVKTNDADGDGKFHDTEQAAHAGDPVTFKVVITNTSADQIALDSITDAYGAVTGLAECPNLLTTVLDPGDAVTCIFTVDDYAPAAGSALTDTVTVGGHQVPGGTPVSGSDTSTVTTKRAPTPGPDLAIVKTADKGKVRTGDTLTYTLSVSNVGDGPTTGAVTVTDTVPSGLDLVSVDGGTFWDCSASGNDITCTYQGGVVQPGDTLPDITIVTRVNSTASIRVVNTGVVNTPGDVNPLNDRSTVKTPVTQVLGEKVTKPKTPTVVLPFTGDRTGQLLPVGLLAVLLGLGLMVTGRRRRSYPV